MILITSNKEKVKEFKNILAPEISFRVRKVEYDEIRSDDCAEIVAIAAKELAEKLGKPVVVDDSGIFIDALNGFPGTYSKHMYYKIGKQGLLKLMKGVRNRKATYISAVAYCEPGKKAEVFVGKDTGTVSQRERGTGGWGHDPLFIPKGQTKTYGELKKRGDIGRHRKRSVMKLKKFLLSRRK